MSAHKGQHDTAHPAELSTYIRNPRVGDVEAIKASLRANSQYRPIVVNTGTHTGREKEVLAGNHTLAAVRDLAEEYPDDERWQSIDIWRIDVDEDQATRIVLADNRTSELGYINDRLVLPMLEEVDDPTSVGYTNVDMDMFTRLYAGSSDDAVSMFDQYVPDDGTTGEQDPEGDEYADDDTYESQSLDEEYVTISWTVTNAQRSIIRRAIRKVQQDNELETSADALLKIAQDLTPEE